MSNTKHDSSARDFARTVRTALTRKGIRITGISLAPGADGTFANGERLYILDDNGTGCVRNWRGVLEVAA